MSAARDALERAAQIDGVDARVWFAHLAYTFAELQESIAAKRYDEALLTTGAWHAKASKIAAAEVESATPAKVVVLPPHDLKARESIYDYCDRRATEAVLADRESRLQGTSEPVEGWQLVPKEPTHEIVKAMAESKARDDEGTFPPVCDLIDYTGGNKLCTVLKQVWRDALAAAPQPTEPS